MKSVLLVNSNREECGLIRELFSELFPDAAVRVTDNGRSALDSLMGAENEEELRLNPDIIIISDSITDFTPSEICSVVSNYYRFRHIKFYLLADPSKLLPESTDRALFNGYINRPFSNDALSREKFALLKPDLQPNNRKLALIPFLGLIKSKLMPFGGSLASGVKAAACIACIGTAAFVIPSLDEKNNAEKQLTVVPVVGALADDHFQPVEILPPAPEPVIVERETVLESTVKKEEAAPVQVPVAEEPAAPKDTIVQKKTFSIGVKRVD